MPHRADADRRGGSIHLDMFQDLLLAEFVVADLTLDNPNVWYEIGVRHALRAGGAVLTYAVRDRLPFDIAGQRMQRYTLKDGRLDPDFVEAERDALKEAIEATLGAWRGRRASPVYQQLPNLTEPDWKTIKVGDIIRKVRESNQKMMFLVLSNAVSEELLSAIAQVGRGVVMSQVMPFPWDAKVAIVKEFNRMNQQYKAKVPVSHAALEGFAAAKLLTIAAQKAGPQADAHKIAEVLRTSGPIDLGGIVYDPQSKSHFVDLTMVSRDGKLIR